MADFATAVIRGPDGDREIVMRPGTSDERTFISIFKNKEYDIGRMRRHAPSLNRIYEQMTGSGVVPLIVDCGANVGFASIYFANRYPKSRVVAIEPEAENVELLRRNCRESDRIDIEHAAIASVPGFARIMDGTINKDAFRTELTSDERSGLPAITIRQLLERYCADESVLPYICKIDIEGAEEELFSQNTEWVSLFPLIIVELHDWLFANQAKSGNFLRCIAQEDRDFVFIGENVFSVRNRPADSDRGRSSSG